MTDQDFQKQMLSEMEKFNSRFDTLEGKFDTLEGRFDTLEGKFDTFEGKLDRVSKDLTEFKSNQEDFNSAIWTLNNQAFDAIGNIQREVVSPWKIRQSKSHTA